MGKDNMNELEERLTVLEEKYRELDEDFTDLVKKIKSNMTINRWISILSTLVILAMFAYFLLVYLPALRH